MTPVVLSNLKSTEFSDEIGFVLPTSPLRRALQRSSKVRSLQTALKYGAITKDDVTRFVDELLTDFRRGEVFVHDIVLSALAVAMEHWSDSFAEVYLLDLARLKRQEFRALFRIARMREGQICISKNRGQENTIFERPSHHFIRVLEGHVKRQALYPKNGSIKLGSKISRGPLFRGKSCQNLNISSFVVRFKKTWKQMRCHSLMSWKTFLPTHFLV